MCDLLAAFFALILQSHVDQLSQAESARRLRSTALEIALILYFPLTSAIQNFWLRSRFLLFVFESSNEAKSLLILAHTIFKAGHLKAICLHEKDKQINNTYSITLLSTFLIVDKH